MTKVLSYGIVGLLAAALLGGTGYILLNPTEAQAGQEQFDGQGQGRGSAGSGAESPGQGQGRGGTDSETGSLVQDAHGRGQDEELGAEEIEGILYMREEEKLARDVYLTLYEQWGLPIFQNIANSEQTHMDAIGTLINRYGLNDPVAGNDVGAFTDPVLQSLYDDLVAMGNQSLAEALRVGAAIEEIDILDLDKYVAQTDVKNIQRVYESLTKGSRNHLRSFVTTLEQQAGETYEPQYLDQSTYDDIVSTPMESDGYGQSQGRGSAGSGVESPGQGQGRGSAGSEMESPGQGRGSAGSEMESPGQGQGRNETERTVEWETLTGEVIVADHEVTIQTAEGEVLVGMGQSAYWESFGLAVGDGITVTGFHEDGEFKAGTVENLTTGETIVLRDETGRPMWAGRGQLKNQDS